MGYGLVMAAIWYTPYRLSRLLGLRRTWPLYNVVAALTSLSPREQEPMDRGCGWQF